MSDDATFRRIALSLPDAHEQDHRGRPSYRVRDRIFATLWPGDGRAVVKLPLADQKALVRSDPEAYSLNAWSRQGWTDVNLRHVHSEEIAELVHAAWREVALKRTIAKYAREQHSRRGHGR